MRIVGDPPVLALFAESVHPEPRPLPDAETEALQALLLRRRQLLHMRTGRVTVLAEKNRTLVAAPTEQKSLAKHIRWLERELATIEDDLDAAIRASPVWWAKEDLLRSVPGVGRGWPRIS